MNINAKVLSKILKQNPTTHKSTVYHNQVNFIPEVQELFNTQRLINISHKKN